MTRQEVNNIIIMIYSYVHIMLITHRHDVQIVFHDELMHEFGTDMNDKKYMITHFYSMNVMI